MISTTKKLTQTEKVLKALRDANGAWVNGRYFLQTLYLSQFHARIHELQKRGYKIESSSERDEYGFVSYRLIEDVEDEDYDPRQKLGGFTEEDYQKM